MAEVPTTPTSLQSQSSVSSSLNEDPQLKSNEEIASELSADFNKFLNFNVSKEEGKFSDSIEMMLTKLDEFFSLVDMIRNDTTLCLSSTLPDIQAKCAEIEATFEKIDKLEEFVNMVRDCVQATEEKVVKAEAELGTVGGLVKKLTSFVSKKKSPVQAGDRGRRTGYVPVDIYSTEQFFDHSNDSVPSGSSPSSKETSFEASDSSIPPRS